jgi:anti-sigma B factor antagonist
MTSTSSKSYPSVHSFDVRVDHNGTLPGRTLARVSGEVDIAAGPRLVSVARLAAACSRDAVLDLAAVSFIDAAGVAGLLAAKRALERCGQYLFVRRVPPSVSRVLRLLELEDAFTVHA